MSVIIFSKSQFDGKNCYKNSKNITMNKYIMRTLFSHQMQTR